MPDDARNFPQESADALVDEQLQRALGNVAAGFRQKRARAVEALPEFAALKAHGVAIRDHTLARLGDYLERFEASVTAGGGQVHWAETADQAVAHVLKICRARNARLVTKGKSMMTEEIGLNEALEQAGIKAVETDLGEYILQLRGEAPSHIIAPAIHLNRNQVEETFRKIHTHLEAGRDLSEIPGLVMEARAVLRQRYMEADIGITGANFLVADTGSTIIVTNEGNGDLTQALPKVHIVVAAIDKVVPTLADAHVLLRLLARSATGQDFSAYTTFSTGPRRADDLTGPEEFHVVLVDGGRSALAGTDEADVLRCIRCGACMNHCPVYGAIGGHAYGWVYPGPIGAALTPALKGVEEMQHLPHASSFCGRCEEVCPMDIPLTAIMRHWREVAHQSAITGAAGRRFLAVWAWVARRPKLYGMVAGLAVWALALIGGKRRRLGRWLPFSGGWTAHRDLPAPEGGRFMQRYKKMRGGRG